MLLALAPHQLLLGAVVLAGGARSCTTLSSGAARALSIVRRGIIWLVDFKIITTRLFVYSVAQLPVIMLKLVIEVFLLIKFCLQILDQTLLLLYSNE